MYSGCIIETSQRTSYRALCLLGSSQMDQCKVSLFSTLSMDGVTMAKRNELYKKYASKHAEIAADVARLEAELEAARAQQQLISGMLSDMDALWDGSVAPASTTNEASAPPAPAPTPVPAPAAAPVAVHAPADYPAIGVPTDAEIHSMSIVDAAVALAQRKGVKEAKASRVHSWFEEVQYQGRNGVPNRNSIYVSLNREASQTEGRPEQRVKKERRGVFRFV